MSRSTRKAWVKDSSKFNYNKIIRTRINQVVKKMLSQDEVEIPNPKTIINDYDICDFRWQVKESWGNVEKYKRK